MPVLAGNALTNTFSFTLGRFEAVGYVAIGLIFFVLLWCCFGEALGWSRLPTLRPCKLSSLSCCCRPRQTAEMDSRDSGTLTV